MAAQPRHVHFVAICGTGMGSLAGLLAARGLRVTGSDEGLYPPMSELLERWKDSIKMVQIGGSTGGIVPASMLTTPLSFETVLGSGAVVVFDESRDVIDFVHRTVEFLNEESCGRCTPCREGTEVMVEIYGRLVKGEGAQEDIGQLEELSNAMMLSSLCGLGQAAPIPVLDTLKYFRNEYQNRISQSIFLRSLRVAGD